MKLVTFKNFSDSETYRLGALISEKEIVDLTPLTAKDYLTASEIIKCFDLDTGFLEKAAKALKEGNLTLLNRARIELAAPVPRPGKIICIGLNYRDHAEESGM